MNGNYFFDTNILVYLFDTSESEKHQKAKQFFSQVQEIGKGYISTQVVNEFIVIATQKIAHPISLDEVEKKLIFLQKRLLIIPLHFETSLKAIQLKQRYQCSYWDSLIIASALECQCTTLYSEDMQHGQIIEKMLTIQNPL